MKIDDRSPTTFCEGTPFGVPIRDLGLAIAGTRIEPLLGEFKKELEQRGIQPLPHFYLSTEWGVPFGTISIAIPFYLARPDLTALHAERAGLVEGVGRTALLRYLRHEMGHVVNYAYKLYESSDWIKLFGSITQPYQDEYRAEPFSRRFVNHLPGWYAQKHPDEDWAETFAVWLNPGIEWRTAYAEWPVALSKLEYCDRTMTALRDSEPIVTEIDPDEAVEAVDASLREYYDEEETDNDAMPPALDGALRTIFEDLEDRDDEDSTAVRLPAAGLMRSHKLGLIANIYRWTGHFPDRTQSLLNHLSQRAERLELQYPAARETEAALALTAFVSALAMNYVLRGSYLP